jgi:hypothetical protein
MNRNVTVQKAAVLSRFYFCPDIRCIMYKSLESGHITKVTSLLRMNGKGQMAASKIGPISV